MPRTSRSRRSRLLAVGALGAAIVALVTVEVADAGFARFWVDHPISTALLSAALVVLVTVIVVDDLVRRREERELGAVIAALAHMLENEARRLDEAARRWAEVPDPTTEAVVLDLIRDFRLATTATASVLVGYPSSKAVLTDAFELAAEIRQQVRNDRPDGHRRAEFLRVVEDECERLQVSAGMERTRRNELASWSPGRRGKGVLEPHEGRLHLVASPPAFHHDLVTAFELDRAKCVFFDVDAEGHILDGAPDHVAQICALDPRLTPPEGDWLFG